MKVLVTGSTGFIGSHLVELLIKNGHEVRCLIRKTSSLNWLKGLPVQYLEGDLFDLAALRRAVEGVGFVYHSAGLTKAKTEEEYFRANVTGTRNLLEAVSEVSPGLSRFVLVSSQTAVGPSPTITPIIEEASPHPITSYGRSKLKAEEACISLASNLNITICRLPAVYGPRDRDVFEFFHTMSMGLQPVVGFRDKYVSLIHVRDVVRGLVLAAESSKAIGQTYFISSKDIYNWRDVGNTTKEVLRKSAFRLRIPEAGVYMIAGIAEVMAKFSPKPALINFEKARDMVQDYWTCDSSKARRDFGYEQEVSLEEGVRDTVSWYKTMGWLK
jgi:nucleoside-diphosphate-sugar epimerase